MKHESRLLFRIHLSLVGFPAFFYDHRDSSVTFQFEMWFTDAFTRTVYSLRINPPFDFRTDAQITVRISGHRILIDEVVFKVVT